MRVPWFSADATRPYFHHRHPRAYLRQTTDNPPAEPFFSIRRFHEQENAEELIDGFMAFHTNVNNEDMGICEAVQSGMSSAPANGGRFSFRFEETIHRFQVTKDSEATPSPQRRVHIHTDLPEPPFDSLTDI